MKRGQTLKELVAQKWYKSYEGWGFPWTDKNWIDAIQSDIRDLHRLFRCYPEWLREETSNEPY